MRVLKVLWFFLCVCYADVKPDDADVELKWRGYGSRLTDHMEILFLPRLEASEKARKPIHVRFVDDVRNILQVYLVATWLLKQRNFAGTSTLESQLHKLGGYLNKLPVTSGKKLRDQRDNIKPKEYRYEKIANLKEQIEKQKRKLSTVRYI